MRLVSLASFFYWREHRSEFNVWQHVILPAIPFVLLGIVIYFQFVPLPAAPFNMVGPIDAAWLVLGIIVVVLLQVHRSRSSGTHSTR